MIVLGDYTVQMKGLSGRTLRLHIHKCTDVRKRKTAVVVIREDHDLIIDFSFWSFQIQDIDMQIKYNDNTEILKLFVCRTAALVFVPIRFVYLAWQGIKANTPDLTRIDEFIEWVSTEVLIQQLAGNAHPPHQRMKAIEEDQHIKEFKKRFSSNVISLSDYVASMSEHTDLWIL